jgi:PUA domain protein
VVIIHGTPLFFAQRDGPWFPTLRLLHQYPDMMKKLRADVGAIKFVLSGAHIMCPGLTSPGATIHDEARRSRPAAPRLSSYPAASLTGVCAQVGADTPVAIYAEGKEHAMAVGLTKMSTKDMRELNKGIGVDNMHYLNDGLWHNSKEKSLA